MNRILLGITATLLVGFGVQTWRVHSLKSDVVTLEAKLSKATERADKSEALRATEQAQASASYVNADARCVDRVTRAHEAGQLIERITNVQAISSGDSVRPVIGADQLRVIIRQGGGHSAASVSSGDSDSAASATAVAR